MADAKILDQLYATILTRKGADPKSSYTAKLFADGRAKIARKLGEESIEAIIAALGEGQDRVASESADLLYHLLVLWAECGVAPAEIWEALEARQGQSGIAEKNARK